MPLYEFETADGLIVEAAYRMADAPELGQVVEINGEPCTRVIRTVPQTPEPGEQENFRLHSNSAPNLAAIRHQEAQAHALQEQGHRAPMPVRAPAYDEKGRAVFRSKRELDSYAKRDGRFTVRNFSETAQDHARDVHQRRKDDGAAIDYREKIARTQEVQT